MRNFLLIILLFSSTLVYSKNNPSNKKDTLEIAKERILTEQYADSLTVLRHKLDSVMLENNALKNANSWDSRYSRLFTPLSFYEDLAQRHFSLSNDDAITTEDQSLIDNALLNIYLNHPELVKGRATVEKQKDSQKPIVKIDKDKPADVAINSYKAPKAEELDMAPIDIVIKKPNFWTISGECYLQMMQNFYSGNWYQGGESNYSGLTRITLKANYNNKQKIKWENILEMNLGFQTNKSDTVHSIKTSSDLLRYTSTIGVKASKKWDYTLKAVANSQFMRSFASNSYNVNSDFLSPFNLNVSLGMDYSINWFNKKLTGKVHLGPLALNYKYVDRLELAKKNGIDEGKHGKVDFGSTFEVRTQWKFSNNVSWDSRLYGYTTYHRMDLQWENTFNLKISRYLAANIYLYPRFDDSSKSRKDDDFGYFQLKEYTSLGLTYSF